MSDDKCDDKLCGIDMDGICLPSKDKDNKLVQAEEGSCRQSPKSASDMEDEAETRDINETENEDTATEDKVRKDAATAYSDNSGTDNKNRSIQADVFMLSGCEDSQTSADVSNVSSFQLPDPNGRAGGACTSALLKVLYSNQAAVTDLTFVKVLTKMRTVLQSGGFSQNPQLTSSQEMDVNQQFYIVPPRCQGTKRAVLIGINYTGQSGELSGCQNDCINIKDYIMNVWGFEEENIVILMDDGNHTNPTRSNILEAYKNLVTNSEDGDAAFCHYSGHGGRVRDDDRGEEADGYDETLIPVDYDTSGFIRDDDLYSNLVCAMSQGVTLVSLMDCCHSATVLDLPFKYGADTTDTNQIGSFVTFGRGKIIIIICIIAVVITIVVLVALYLA